MGGIVQGDMEQTLLAPKNPIIHIPIPQVNTIIRDMENDVNQLLADCAGMVEQV